ncbi:MAG: hypothetical protein RBG13Loki_0838 [Promethearchaeota archaeon CR_4]|nr:MAG: hypothetical protein RBG13Loki_0838 [Candidatus Lokiarchaeota archaeon CR_4]
MELPGFVWDGSCSGVILFVGTLCLRIGFSGMKSEP